MKTVKGTEYLTFKNLMWLLSTVKTKEDFNAFCGEVDLSYQHGKITANDNALIYRIVNNQLRRDFID